MALAFSAWYDEVKESADWAVSRTVLRELVAAARDLYERVPAMERTETGLTAAATVSLTPGGDEEVASIYHVSQNGVPVSLVTIAQLNASDPAWREWDVAEQSSRAVAEPELGQFTPLPTPDTVDGSPVDFICTYSVMPSLTATTIADTAIANRHKNLIISGAKARLAGIAGMPGYDRKAAALMMADFFADVAREEVLYERKWSKVLEKVASPLHPW